MTEHSELKACPFCGYPPVLHQIPNDGWWELGCHTAGCVRPRVATCSPANKRKAIAAWNTRHPAAQSDVVEATTEEVIDLINIVTELQEADALDKAFPEVFDRMKAFASRINTKAEGMEAAAVIAENAIILLDIGTPGEGPFTRDDRTVDATKAAIAQAIRTAAQEQKT